MTLWEEIEKVMELDVQCWECLTCLHHKKFISSFLHSKVERRKHMEVIFNSGGITPFPIIENFLKNNWTSNKGMPMVNIPSSRMESKLKCLWYEFAKDWGLLTLLDFHLVIFFTIWNNLCWSLLLHPFTIHRHLPS